MTAFLYSFSLLFCFSLFCASSLFSSPLFSTGTRLMGGKDAASPRYVFTKLENITRCIFHPHDDPLLDKLDALRIVKKPKRPFNYEEKRGRPKNVEVYPVEKMRAFMFDLPCYRRNKLCPPCELKNLSTEATDSPVPMPEWSWFRMCFPANW